MTKQDLVTEVIEKAYWLDVQLSLIKWTEVSSALDDIDINDLKKLLKELKKTDESLIKLNSVVEKHIAESLVENLQELEITE